MIDKIMGSSEELWFLFFWFWKKIVGSVGFLRSVELVQTNIFFFFLPWDPL